MDARGEWGTYRTAETSGALATLEEKRTPRTSLVIATIAAVLLFFALPFILYACGVFDVEGALAVIPR